MGKRENAAERRQRRERKAQARKVKEKKAKMKESVAPKEVEEDIDAILRVCLWRSI